jgi:DNA polymerase
MKTRKDKLVALRDFIDLETGDIHEVSFEYEQSLYKKAVAKKALDARIKVCERCPGMNIKRITESCPGWGDLNASVFFVGQSLHRPGVSSGIPFILGSGYLLDAALRLSGLLRKDVFITNAVHCHPSKNRASLTDEKENCLNFLKQEITIVQPKLVVALGNDAHWAVRKLLTPKTRKKGNSDISWLVPMPKVLCLKHPASFLHSAPHACIDWIVKLSLEIDKI